MAILGPSSNLDSLTNSLDPDLLVRLAADILAERGHDDIRVTDGPGDGCRDIHSTDPEGERYLTQCKFKEDPTKTVTNADASELPIGLMKLGYQRGLFVTNGRISPPAKREYLDNYPGYKLDFLDGLALTREICDSAMLLALWVHGDKLEKANAALSIPFIIRDLIHDRPVALKDLEAALETLAARIRQRFGRFTCLVDADAPMHMMRFDPYRPPSFASAGEGTRATLRAAEFTFRGDVSRAEFHPLRDAIVEALPSVLQGGADVPQVFAFRVGSPQIVPLSGSCAGARYDIPEAPTTYWCTSSGTATESAMLCPTWYSGDEESRLHGWVERSDARVSESSWVRLFHPEHNACVDCRIITTPSVEQRLRRDAIRSACLRRWEQSIFVLVPRDLLNLLEKEVPKPGLRCFVGNGVVMGWLHSELADGAVRFTNEHEPLSPGFVKVAEKMGMRGGGAPEEEIMKAVMAALGKIGHKEGLLPPRMARHVLAFHHADPIPDNDTVEYRTCDVLLAFNNLPSPLVPGCRKLRLETVWKNEGMAAERFDDMVLLDQLEEAVAESVCAVLGPDVDCTVNAERLGAMNEIAVLRMTAVLPPDLQSTDAVLVALEGRLAELSRVTAAALNNLISEWVLGTSWYWKQRYNIDFWPPPEGTDKVHAWYYNSDDSLGAVYTHGRGYRPASDFDAEAMHMELRPPVLDDEGHHSPELVIGIRRGG